MNNFVFNVLERYFINLTNTGYRKNSDVKKVLLLSHINKLLNNNFRGFITEDDYKKIERALYCLYGSSCLIPYPNYYNIKNPSVMYNGSISELTHRVINAEKKVDTIKEINESIYKDLSDIKNADIVIPGEDIKSVDDFDLEG